jgi:acetyl esterase/lipase
MNSTLLCLLALLHAPQERRPPEGVEFQRDVTYGRGGGEELQLNLARPADAAGPGACVVVIHGGGWKAGHRSAHDHLTWRFAARGYVSATLGYRLAPRHRFPAQVEDVKCAVRFLRAHAEKYGIDPDRVGAIGFSAGAHLAMMLAVAGPEDGLEGEGGWADQPSRVSAAVSFFGPTDLAAKDLPEGTEPFLRDFLGGTAEERAGLCRKASPVTYVTKGDAPILLLQGTKDPLVPYTQATVMVEAMTREGVRGRADLIVGAGHGWLGPELERTMDTSFRFLEAHLKPRKER